MNVCFDKEVFANYEQFEPVDHKHLLAEDKLQELKTNLKLHLLVACKCKSEKF